MMILWKEKLAFIAIPKTGTTAIEAALAPYAAISFERPPQIKHMTLQRFNRFIRPYLEKTGLEDVQTLAVMREPVDWLGSWYRYRRRDAIRGSSKSTADVSFDEFVEAYLGAGKRPDFAEIGSQANQMSKNRGVVGVDHIYRYEDLPKVVDFLSDRLGRNLKLGEKNASEKMPVTLSPELTRRYQRQYALDFDTYHSIK